MRRGIRTIHLAVLAIGTIGLPHAAQAALALHFEDPLTSNAVVAGEASKRVKEGKFVERGWESTSSASQIVIELAEPFAPGEGGAVEIDITNFDPVKQYAGSKHQFFNVYSRPDGSKERWDEDGKCWVNVRGGRNYMKSGGAGFKLLCAPRGLKSRHERRLIESTKTWDPARTYVLRLQWDDRTVGVWLDGRRLCSFAFADRTELLSHVFIGTDNVYSGFAGPVYTRLRVYRDALWLARRKKRVRDAVSANRTASPNAAARTTAASSRTTARRSPTPEALTARDGELKKLVRASLAANGKPGLFLGRMRTQVRVLGCDDLGDLRVASVRPRMELSVRWGDLTHADKLSLVTSMLRAGNAGDHALAAFYAIAAGDEKRAREHLRNCPGAAAEMKAAFGGAPAPNVK